MTIQKISNAILYGLSSDTKPTTYANNTLFIETDTANIYQSQSGVWTLFSGASTYTSVGKTSNYTLTATDARIRADATSGALTLTLPTAVGITGKHYGVKKIDTSTNFVIIDPNSSETIEGLSTWELRSTGADIEFISDGTNWRVITYDELDITGYRRVGTTPNRWYIGGLVGATAIGAGAALVTNTLYATPFITSKIVTANSLGVNVGTGVGSTAVRLGIYKDDGNLYPGALVAEISTQPSTVTTTTFVSGTFTSSPVLQPGIYWLVMNTSGAPNLKTVAVAGAIPILGIDNTAASTAFGLGWSVTRTYAALGTPFTASGAVLTTIPAIYIRLA